MSDTSFFSSNSYIFLPTKKNPKVALAVDNSKLSNNAFKLYNPFSSKAKFLKEIAMFISVNLNLVGALFSTKKEKSDFVKYLEEILKQPLVVSLYFATINDKVVMQLQSSDTKILGYIKYPLNEIGLKHIRNEIKAFELLSEIKIIEPYILCNEYDDKPFLFLKELDGDIGIVKHIHIKSILQKFERKILYRLVKHPRILEMKKLLFKNDMTEYIAKIDAITNNSILEYKLVYEHGDFTPWNIIKIKDKHIPFDFEYFVEDGLEYFDIIKYYYQIGKLLKNKRDEELARFIIKQTNIQEISELLELFLIKEIIRGKEENEPFVFEENMIKTLELL